jgi:hypothetical protein
MQQPQFSGRALDMKRAVGPLIGSQRLRLHSTWFSSTLHLDACTVVGWRYARGNERVEEEIRRRSMRSAVWVMTLAGACEG